MHSKYLFYVLGSKPWSTETSKKSCSAWKWHRHSPQIPRRASALCKKRWRFWSSSIPDMTKSRSLMYHVPETRIGGSIQFYRSVFLWRWQSHWPPPPFFLLDVKRKGCVYSFATDRTRDKPWWWLQHTAVGSVPSPLNILPPWRG